MNSMVEKNAHHSERTVYSPREFHEQIVNREMSLSGIYAAIRKGEIPSKRIGSRVFIPADFVASLKAL